MKKKPIRARRTPKVRRGDSPTASTARKSRAITVPLGPWRPIRTAPRDGRDLLVTWVYKVDEEREYCPGHFILAYRKNWYGTGKGAWVYQGDFAVRFEPDGVHHMPEVINEWDTPTHWMPLPMLPITRKK